MVEDKKVLDRLKRKTRSYDAAVICEQVELGRLMEQSASQNQSKEVYPLKQFIANNHLTPEQNSEAQELARFYLDALRFSSDKEINSSTLLNAVDLSDIKSPGEFEKRQILWALVDSGAVEFTANRRLKLRPQPNRVNN